MGQLLGVPVEICACTGVLSARPSAVHVLPPAYNDKRVICSGDVRRLQLYAGPSPIHQTLDHK